MKETLDFIIIGAQKSGTTSLFEYLRRHPDLSLPEGKEAPFFSDDEARSRGWEDYIHKAFAFSDPGAKWGTVTPQYMVGGLMDHPNPGPDGDVYDERTIPTRIRTHTPNARLIAILRDPVERARSHHRMASMVGLEKRPFADAIDELLRSDSLERSRRLPAEVTGYVTWGEYGRILSGYLDVFSRDQLLVVFTEELERAPERLLARIHAFLGVASDSMPDNLGTRYRAAGSKRRFAWLRPYGLQHAVSDRPVMRALWHMLPEVTRRRIDRRFIRASYHLDLWNRRDAVVVNEPEPGTLERLREHFTQDVDRLEADFQLSVPWKKSVSTG